MILHPAVLALLAMSFLVSIMALVAVYVGVRIMRSWDIRSGSELQIGLERRTYLISSILGYVFIFQILSLFLFIYTADALHVLFAGAMCAAGSLQANAYGYPVLILKILNFLLAGTWLIFNFADTRGYDYPLIRSKYAMLLVLTPLLLLEGSLQFRYFKGLHADVITSCCGSLFSRNSETIIGDIAAMPAKPSAIAFYAAMVGTFASGSYFILKDKAGWLFSLSSVVTFLVAAASTVSFFCLYLYELPTHHCPFCFLQKEYGYIGYILYATLLCGTVTGMATGVLMPWKGHRSMVRFIPSLQRRLTLLTLVLYLLFTIVVTYWLVFSPLKLGNVY